MKVRRIEACDDEAMGTIIHRILHGEYNVGEGTAAADPNVFSLSAFYAINPKTRYFVATDEAGKVIGGGGIGLIEGYCC